MNCNFKLLSIMNSNWCLTWTVEKYDKWLEQQDIVGPVPCIVITPLVDHLKATKYQFSMPLKTPKISNRVKNL